MISTIILCLTIFLSGLIALISFIGWLEGALSARWPSTTGEVVSSEIRKKEKKKKDEIEVKYKPVVVYRYNVDGKTYENDRHALGWQDVIRDEGKARSILDNYPDGMKLDVYYSPRKPENSVLLPGHGQGTHSMLFWSSIIFIFSVMAIVMK